jgi:hypothetical protein
VRERERVREEGRKERGVKGEEKGGEQNRTELR